MLVVAASIIKKKIAVRSGRVKLQIGCGGSAHALPPLVKQLQCARHALIRTQQCTIRYEISRKKMEKGKGFGNEKIEENIISRDGRFHLSTVLTSRKTSGV